MKPWDIIGDIHGEAEKLQTLLLKLGYVNTGDDRMPLYQHPRRRACFLGDYIDRGPEIVQTLNIVRNMCEHSQARAILGNHELNFLAYHTLVRGKSAKTHAGDYLRDHTEKNKLEIAKTLREFSTLKDGGEGFKKWFFSLPYYLDLGDIRLIHACWDADAIKVLNTAPHFKDTSGFFTAQNLGYLRYLPSEARAVDRLLKGRGFRLPSSLFFKDVEGIARRNIRLKWWKNPTTQLDHLRRVLLSAQKQQSLATDGNTATEHIKSIQDTKHIWPIRLEAIPAASFQQIASILDDIFFLPSLDKELFLKKFIALLSEALLDELSGKFSEYPDSAKPLFIGHYWLHMTEAPMLLKPNLACLDYSAAYKGHLCAYSYHGEKTLNHENFTWV